MDEPGMTDRTLQERLERIEAIEDIRRLKHRYCSFCDRGYDPEGIASLFTEDGTWEDGRSFLSGRAELVRYFGAAPDYIRFAAHMVTNSIIDVDGNTAHGRWWLLMACTRMRRGEPQGAWMLGEYDEDYLRLDGQWKFARLRLAEKFFTSTLDDWALRSLRSNS